MRIARACAVPLVAMPLSHPALAQSRKLSGAELQALIGSSYMAAGVTESGWAYMLVSYAGGTGDVYVNDFFGQSRTRTDKAAVEGDRLCVVRGDSGQERCYEFRALGRRALRVVAGRQAVLRVAALQAELNRPNCTPKRRAHPGRVRRRRPSRAPARRLTVGPGEPPRRHRGDHALVYREESAARVIDDRLGRLAPDAAQVRPRDGPQRLRRLTGDLLLDARLVEHAGRDASPCDEAIERRPGDRLARHESTALRARVRGQIVALDRHRLVGNDEDRLQAEPVLLALETSDAAQLLAGPQQPRRTTIVSGDGERHRDAGLVSVLVIDGMALNQRHLLTEGRGRREKSCQDSESNSHAFSP